MLDTDQNSTARRSARTRPRPLAVALSAITIALGIAAASAGAASAAAIHPNGSTSGTGSPGWYQVFGTDGTLAVQSQPSVGHVIGSVPEGTFVYVVCQVNNGGTDWPDGLYSHTWDKLATSNGSVAWVYDHYISTPLQNSAGWSLNTSC